MTVEDGEQTDPAHGHREWSFDAKGDDGAKHDHRQRDAKFDKRHRNSGDAEKAAERHDADKDKRHEPQCPSAELIGENTDQDHGELMIEAAERMHKSVHEPARAADADMGESSGRSEKKREGCELKKPLHRVSPSLGCKLCLQAGKHTYNKPHTTGCHASQRRKRICDCLLGMQFGEIRHTGTQGGHDEVLSACGLAQTLHAPRRSLPLIAVGMMMDVVAVRNFALFSRLEGHAHDLAVAHAALGDGCSPKCWTSSVLPLSTVTSRQVS